MLNLPFPFLRLESRLLLVADTFDVITFFKFLMGDFLFILLEFQRVP